MIGDVAVHYSLFTVDRQNLGETMATAKTTTLTFRIEPALKEALRTAAEREHRSIANMVAVPLAVVADKGYDSDANRAMARERGTVPIIPHLNPSTRSRNTG